MENLLLSDLGPTVDSGLISQAACVAGLSRWQFALEEQVSHPSNGGPLFVGSLPARQPDAYYALLPMRVPKMAKARIPGDTNMRFFATNERLGPCMPICARFVRLHVPLVFLKHLGCLCEQGAMAVLGIGLGTQEPHFTLVLNGEPLLTLSDNSAVFPVAAAVAAGACLRCWVSLGGTCEHHVQHHVNGWLTQLNDCCLEMHQLLQSRATVVCRLLIDSASNLQAAKTAGGGLIGGRSLEYLKLAAVLKAGRQKQ